MSRLLPKPQALLLVLVALSPFLLPNSARAQFALAPGTYQLANGAQGAASLKFVPAEADHPTLVTGVRNGQERSFRCAEVAAFTVDNHKFSRQDGFRLRAGYDTQHPGPVLLELIETGPVELFYYHYVAEMGASLKAHVRLPVLRKQGTQTFFVYSPQRTPGLSPGQGNGTFAAALFGTDPVLQRRFATNAVTRTDIADLVRAYNQGAKLKL
jgi:hypothetical protein